MILYYDVNLFFHNLYNLICIIQELIKTKNTKRFATNSIL